MDFLAHLATGFAVALTPFNLFFCLVGALLGTLIGVLPGIGPAATIAMLLPITYALSPTSSLIMLAGIYYGAQYGGSTTAILINLPGESSSAVTALDGYQMALRGRAGPALAIAAIGSFIAGTVSTLVIAIFAPPLTTLALEFGPAEYFSLIVLGLISSVTLARGSVFKAIPMIIMGLLLGIVGTDVNSGVQRFTLGILELGDGLNFVALAVGIFGFAEFLRGLENETERTVVVRQVTGLMPTRQDMRQSAMPILRGTIVGSLLGILPGGGSILASFASYTVEKRLSREPQTFGHGAIEGVAGPESANNAGAQTSFIPMLSLGIPSNPVMALMIGAMIMQGIVPGPNIITERPELFWGLIASMWVGNLMLVVINLPLIGVWLRLLSVPYYTLFPAIVAFSTIGVFTINNQAFDIYALAAFCVLGYVFLKLDCEPAPLLLGFILGPMLEEHLRRAMIESLGDPTVFITSPISAGLLLLSLIMLIIVMFPSIASRRETVFVED